MTERFGLQIKTMVWLNSQLPFKRKLYRSQDRPKVLFMEWVIQEEKWPLLAEGCRFLSQLSISRGCTP